MAKKHSGKRGRRVPKTVLRLPDLDQAKSAVLNSHCVNLFNCAHINGCQGRSVVLYLIPT